MSGYVFGKHCTSFKEIPTFTFYEWINNGEKSDDPILERGEMGKIEKRRIFAKKIENEKS